MEFLLTPIEYGASELQALALMSGTAGEVMIVLFDGDYQRVGRVCFTFPATEHGVLDDAELLALATAQLQAGELVGQALAAHHRTVTVELDKPRSGADSAPGAP